MDQRPYWNRVSDEKTFTLPLNATLFAQYVPHHAAILDVGCGYGRTLNELYQAGYRNLTGVDFSEGMIRRGRALHPDLDLRVGDGTKLNLSERSMDAAILFAVLTCVPENDSQIALIQAIRNVLKPGGILYINDYLLGDDPRNRRRYEAALPKYGVYGIFELPEGAVCRHHDESWIRALLSDFEILAFDRVTYTTMNGHAANGFSCLARAL